MSALSRASLGDIEARHSVYRQILRDLKTGTSVGRKAVLDEEMVEMPPEFFELFLGKRLVETCCYFPTGAEDLDEAEETMLWMTADRAKIRDGMNILELGCGLGAMTFWLARQYPDAQITAVTDSIGKRIYIQKKIHELEINNVKVITSDFVDLKFEIKFDRIISVEKFAFNSACPKWDEKIAKWLKEDGKFFFQLPVHSQYAFYYDSVGFEDLPGNIVSRNRLCLSFDMPLLFQNHFSIEDLWRISGEHYKLTSEKRLKKYYFNRLQVLPSFEKAYGKRMAWIWFQRWRLSLLSSSELFGFDRGQSWICAQYLFSKKV
ncbi:MAG: cyclopropane-fatty-acyl-phospholipid synthase family protein [Candidatus Rifleibacteriota bacterium]